MMRGKAECQSTLLLGETADQLLLTHHPTRRIKPIVDQALAALSSTFAQKYVAFGRPSLPVSLLLALYSVRSER